MNKVNKMNKCKKLKLIHRKLAVSKDVAEVAVSKDVAEVAVSKDVAEVAEDVAEVAVSKDVAEVAVSKDVAEVAVSEDVAEVAVSEDVAEVAVSKDVAEVAEDVAEVAEDVATKKTKTPKKTKSPKKSKDEPMCEICFSAKMSFKCFKCNYGYCKSCAKTCLTDYGLEPQCGNCSAVWGMVFVSANITKAFARGDYKKCVAKSEIELQKSRIAEEITNMELEQQRKNHYGGAKQRVLSHRYYVGIVDTPCECYDACTCGVTQQLRDTIIMYKLAPQMDINTPTKLIRSGYEKRPCNCIVFGKDACVCGYEQLYDKYVASYKSKSHRFCECVYKCSCGHVDDRVRMRDDFSYQEVRVEKAESGFVYRCCKENCGGFLTDWKCLKCQARTCAQCLQERKPDVEHVCDASGVAIKKDSRPCPGCGMGVFRIDGCPQMWCTRCKTAFDFNTGKKCKGAVHNPHYFEWRRNHEAEEPVIVDDGEHGCGLELPDLLWMVNIGFQGAPSLIIRNLINGCDIYDRNITSHENYTTLRRKFASGKITEEKFERQVALQKMRHMFYTEQKQVLDFAYETARGLFKACILNHIRENKPKQRRGVYLCDGTILHAEFDGCFAQLDGLIEYSNSVLKKNAEIHQKSEITINGLFEISNK